MEKAFIHVCLDDVKTAAADIGIKNGKAKKLFDHMQKLHVSRVDKKPKRKLPTPKLKDVLNPKSKYFDDTADLTQQVSLVWYAHQQAMKRYRHKRVKKDDRQWSSLVAIKRELLKLDGITENNILRWSGFVFMEAERLSAKIGKVGLYLSMVLARMDEIIDNIDASMELSLTKRHKRIHRLYCVKRSQATGKGYYRKLIKGSDENRLIIKISRIIRRYDITIQKFLKIQFDAFAFHNSFPKLNDLCTDKAIDRIDLHIQKKKAIAEEDSDVKRSKDEDEYWKIINKDKD